MSFFYYFVFHRNVEYVILTKGIRIVRPIAAEDGKRQEIMWNGRTEVRMIYRDGGSGCGGMRGKIAGGAYSGAGGTQEAGQAPQENNRSGADSADFDTYCALRFAVYQGKFSGK